jgi:Fungal protein kinase
MTNMVIRIALEWPIMQATFSDATDPNGSQLIEDRAIPPVKHQLRAASSQNLPHDTTIDKAQFQEKVMNIELENSIYELEGSGPNSLIERTFPDSAVPFNLTELLNAKILQFPKPVEGLVDTHLLHVTDPSFGCRDPPPPPLLQKEVALKTYLKTPPVGNEDRMAQWMNRIGELIEDKVPQVRNYVTIEGEQSTLPQRRWTAAAAEKPLVASSPYGLKRKPDVALISMINSENMSLTESDAWSKVYALCEISLTNFSGNMTIEATLQQKSYIMFMEQDDRSFNPTLFFSGNSFGFHVFDRTGLRRFVAQLSATSSPKHILRILGCLFFGRPATVGYDETIRSESGRAKEIYHDKKWWTVGRELHKSESFVGRSTKCWTVSREEDGGRKTLVLKDTWASTSHAETEPNILRRIRDENINQGRSLPQFHSWSRVDVPISNNEVDSAGRPLMTSDSTSRRSPRDSSTPGQADPDQSSRDHCRLLFGPVAYPLSCFVNLKDLVGIFFDVVQGMFSYLSLYTFC